MNEKKVKKVNAGYLLAAIFIPVVLIIAGGFLAGTVFIDEKTLFMASYSVPLVMSVVWWIFGPTTIWSQKKKKMMKTLTAQGFNRNQTFYGSNQTVAVDIRQGKVALLFFWNPFDLYVLSASRITKGWTEDGAGGAGFLRGTSRVSFLFLIDDIKIRVNTFTSNQRWKMDDPKILEAVSKADMMVQVLNEAKQATGN